MKTNKIKTALCVTAAAIAGVSGLLSVKWVRETEPTIPVHSETVTAEEKPPEFDYEGLSKSLSLICSKNISVDILKNFSDEELTALSNASKDGFLTNEEWHQSIGYTLNALTDVFGTKESVDMGNNGRDSFVLGFTGDINFTYSGYVMTHARTLPGSVLDCIDETFQNEMKSADIMLVNNEFPYSDRGEPQPDKKFTFRSEPENVKYLADMGVDIVSLANNHAYDYGHDAFIDTMAILDEAGIARVGAGMNAQEASAPATFVINGYKVAYLACCGVESPIKTPVAGEDSEGIMGSYDGGEAMVTAIKAAKEYCDYVIVYPHWGYENTTELTAAQKANGKKYIDAGADAVIGDHSHILQGMEFYNGKPIIYSMGNFWFNTRNQPTIMLKLEIGRGGEMTTTIIPGMQENSETHYMEDEAEQRWLYDSIVSWSPVNSITIDDNGIVTPKDNSETELSQPSE